MAAPPAPREAAPDAPAGEAAAPDARECPRCGAPYERLQEYCLECGLRLPVDESVATAVTTVWRRRGRAYAGEWLWPVLVAFVVAVVATVAAVAAARGGDEDGAAVATLPQPASVPVTDAEAVEPPPTIAPTLTATAETQPPPRTQAPPRRGIVGWPRGTNGFTIVLRSVPQERGRARAVELARRARSAGLQTVGVLDSNAYASFHPGYFVVFSGVHRSESDALGGIDEARSAGYADAYVKRVTR